MSRDLYIPSHTGAAGQYLCKIYENGQFKELRWLTINEEHLDGGEEDEE